MSCFFIDAYSQIYRMFFAIRMLNTVSGEPCNAVYGMVRLFQQLHEHYASEYGAIVFDKGKCTRRCALHPEYKAQRPPMPEQLRAQVEPIRQWAEAFGWRIVEKDGAEADDLICGMTYACQPMPTLILTSDKDIAQLTELDGVRILNRGNGKEAWTEDDFAAVGQKFGVKPEQLRDYLALLGDSADNIPGITGCGPKSAAKLLNEFGNIDGIYARLDAVKPARLQEALRAEREKLLLNCSLIELDHTLPDGWQGKESIRRVTPNWNALRELSARFGFKSMNEFIDKNAPAVRSAPQQLTFF